MGLRLRTAVGQLCLVAGNIKERADNVRVVEPGPHTEGWGKGNLYVLLDVWGKDPTPPKLYRELAEVITRRYFQGKGDITERLREAALAANAHLWEHNKGLPPEQRRVGGLACAAFKDGELHLALIGPAMAYVALQGRLTHFPRLPSEVDLDTFLEELHSTPLGIRREPEVALFHLSMRPGDCFLLSTVSLAQRASSQDVANAIVYQEMDLALANLQELMEGGDLSALLVEVEGVPKEMPEPLPQRRPVSRRRVQVDLGSIMTALVRRLFALGKALLDRRERLLPSRAVRAHRPVRVRRRRGRWAWIRENPWKTTALLLPLLVLLLAGGLYWWENRARHIRFSKLITHAEQLETQALSATDKATRRGLLEQALQSSQEALKLGIQSPQAEELRQRIQARLDEVNAVVRLTSVKELHEYPEASELKRIVANGADLFVLDKGTDVVYHHRMKPSGEGLETPEEVIRRGMTLENTVIGELVDMVWMNPGDSRRKSGLLVLDSEGTLVEYSPSWGELAILKLEDKGEWRYPELTGSYFGRFYLLDSQSDQIFRYEYDPVFGGYRKSEQPLYFPPDQKPDLTGVVDMAIDGYIYLLYANGELKRFFGGVPDPLDLSDLDKPFKAPVALFTGPEEGVPRPVKYIYVADVGNERIVQLAKDGTLVAQFLLQGKEEEKHLFKDIKGLFVDELGGSLYFLSGRKLYAVSLPQRK